jgi:threonine dehydrogenase-like Zn-dependent dehydrogenase
MRAAIQTGLRQVEVRDVPEPAIAEGSALVRVRAAGICGSDLIRIASAPSRRFYLTATKSRARSAISRPTIAGRFASATS